MRLETLLHRLTWLTLELANLTARDNVGDLPFELGKSLQNRVCSRLLIDDDITNTNSEAFAKQPIIDELLDSTEELRTSFVTIFPENQVHESLTNRTYDLLVNAAHDELTLLNQNIGVLWAAVRVHSVLLLLQVQVGD